MFKKIAFVCLGNICRSPTAEAIARSRVAERNVSLEVESYGTGSWHLGGNADTQAIRALSRAGYSHIGHSARQIASKIIEEDTLYVALDYSNYRNLLNFPYLSSHREHVTMLRFFDPDLSELPKRPSTAFDVADPYYEDDAFYDETLTVIERCITPLIDFVLR